MEKTTLALVISFGLIFAEVTPARITAAAAAPANANGETRAATFRETLAATGQENTDAENAPHEVETPGDNQPEQEKQLYSFAGSVLTLITAPAAEASSKQNTGCAASKYRQEKFNRPAALAEFRDFQQRLRKSIHSFVTVNDPSAKVDEDTMMKQLRKAFSDSVAGGPKGDALLASFVAPVGNRIVSPMGVMLDEVQSSACPVGFGGKFTDDGREVELWYVDLAPGSDDAMEAFRKPELPAYGRLTRDTFPALVFERDKRGKLKWYGASREMARILGHWYNIQLQ